MPDRPDLSALLGSRICHDLISPIGAISNGVELLMLDGGTPGPEIALIAESVGHANARIRFFRIAFGACTGDQRLGRPEVKALLADLARGSRLSFDWTGPQDMPRREVKLAFLLIMCLETAMVHGGRIRIERDDRGWHILGLGPKLRIDPDLWEVLSNPGARHQITAAQVQFALVPDELTRLGRTLGVETRDGEIRLSF
ncbi:MAG: histidine phosphotransferase [Rhodobacterales bacterium 65-51]|uniref:histidine phosphotransferase family protein n=1 Tax=uncultured Gemmobacter sp. TaxID=1095917 RepID=UPI000960E70D|nr:histidine phosphotransferase family protein [uncultured Gemmobacter sp.]OJY32131.1 MAG: histidine phosphotransferase [Rhodobacterales bacterium 65-51]